MRHQQVSVDYWAMLKAMMMYGGLTILGWMMFRLINVVFALPRRLRNHQKNMQETLQELQTRYPDLNITEDDLKNAEKELEEWTKEVEEKTKDVDGNRNTEAVTELDTNAAVEDKKKI